MDHIEIKEGSSTSSDSDGKASVGDRREDSSQNGLLGKDSNVVDFPNLKRIKPKLKKVTKKERRKKVAGKKDMMRLAMVLPDLVADREKERFLSRIATKGVVQLFNAVSERQKELEDKLFSSNSKLDKATKKNTLKRLGGAVFEKRLARMRDIKDEASVKTEANGDADTSFIKTEPESEED